MKPDHIVAPVVSSALSPARYAALQRWLRGNLPRPAAPAIPPRPNVDHAPLSSGQLRLWMLQQIDPASTAYNEADAVRLHGPIDVDALRAASNAIVERHEILRTTYQMIDGQLRQVIAPRLTLPMVAEDLSTTPAERREEQLRDRLARAVDRPFDLARGPIMRTRLFRLGREEHVLLRCVHHCAWDEWSTVIWTRELMELYARLAAGAPAAAAVLALPPLPIQYADYAAWEHEQWVQQSPAFAAHLAYWRERLADCSPIRLLTDRPRSVPVDERARNWSVAASEGCTAKLHDLVRRERTTLFTVLLAAFQLLLARGTGQHDICLGTPVAIRSRAETENLIGFFVNTVVVRTDLSGNPTLGELLRRVHNETIAAVSHLELPFERLVAAMNPERDSGHSPLVQVAFAFQPMSHQHAPSTALTPERLPLDAPTTKFDLQLVMGEVPATAAGAGALVGTFTYRAALFDDATIERLASRYLVLLEEMAGDGAATATAGAAALTRTPRTEGS